jgi:hypothetical protein
MSLQERTAKKRPGSHDEANFTQTAKQRRRDEDAKTWAKSPDGLASLRLMRDEHLIASPIAVLRLEGAPDLRAGEWGRFAADLQCRQAAFLRSYINPFGPLPKTLMTLGTDHRFVAVNALWLGDVLTGLRKAVPGFDRMLAPLGKGGAFWRNRQADLLCKYSDLEKASGRSSERGDHEGSVSINKAADRAADQFNREVARHNELLKVSGSGRPQVKFVSANTLRRVDKKPLASRFVSNAGAIVHVLNFRKTHDRARESALVEWRSVAHGADLAALDYILRDDVRGLPSVPGKSARVFRALDALDAARDELTALGLYDSYARLPEAAPWASSRSHASGRPPSSGEFK